MKFNPNNNENIFISLNTLKEHIKTNRQKNARFTTQLRLKSSLSNAAI